MGSVYKLFQDQNRDRKTIQPGRRGPTPRRSPVGVHRGEASSHLHACFVAEAHAVDDDGPIAADRDPDVVAGRAGASAALGDGAAAGEVVRGAACVHAPLDVLGVGRDLEGVGRVRILATLAVQAGPAIVNVDCACAGLAPE